MRKLRDILGVVVLCLFILSFSIAFILLFKPLYAWSIDHLNIPAQSGMTKDILLKNYDVLISYLINPTVKTLSLPNFPSSANGLFHFQEVKDLFLLNMFILMITSVLSGIFLYQLKKQQRIWILIKPLFYVTLIPIVSVFLIYLNFDFLFVLFHKVAFNNDMWIFNASTDPIILALPQEFFMYCFIIVFLMVEFLAVSGYFLAKKFGFPFVTHKKHELD